MSRILKVNTAPTLTVAGAYSIGDVIGAKITFANVFTRVSRSAKLNQVLVHDKDNQRIVSDLVLFDEDPTATTFTDNSALAVAAADLTKVIAVIPVPAANYEAFSANAVACVQVTNLGLTRAVEGMDLYGCFVARGTPTYTAGNLSISLVIERDQ